MKRVIFYFDGFNFYNGLKDKLGENPHWKNYYWIVSQLHFDIAVTATEESNKSGHAGINVLSLKLGGDMANKDSNQTVSRVEFDLYIIFPSMEMPFNPRPLQ